MSSEGLFATCLLHLRVLLTFLTKPTTTVMFFVTDWVKVEIFFTQPLLTLFYLHFFTKNLILWLLFIIIYQVFMAQQCSPLALCHFKAKRWLAKNARETWLREWVASETRGVFAPRPAVHVCVCQIMRFWGFESTSMKSETGWVLCIASSVEHLKNRKKRLKANT